MDADIGMCVGKVAARVRARANKELDVKTYRALAEEKEKVFREVWGEN